MHLCIRPTASHSSCVSPETFELLLVLMAGVTEVHLIFMT